MSALNSSVLHFEVAETNYKKKQSLSKNSLCRLRDWCSYWCSLTWTLFTLRANKGGSHNRVMENGSSKCWLHILVHMQISFQRNLNQLTNSPTNYTMDHMVANYKTKNLSCTQPLPEKIPNIENSILPLGH